MTDARLVAPLQRLLAGSPTARQVTDALGRSGLPVVIGSPADLAALPESEGGGEVDERGALLGQTNGLGSAHELRRAWMVFRVRLDRRVERVERAWIVIDVYGIEEMIRAQSRRDPEALILDDLTIALAHELVAHVGSVAKSGKLRDFCDDPAPGEKANEATACSIRMENQLRRELNEGLRLEGARRFPERKNYGLEAMYFSGRP